MPSVADEPGLQEAKSARAREKICRAVTACLVERGYAETSISRVVARAGISKGALQHHFRSKEDMMTATAEWLLGNATFLHIRNTRSPRSQRSLARELLRTWDKGANTDEFRALLEILVKIRTDEQLKSRLATRLQAWQQRATQLTREGYEAVSGDDREVELLLTMNSCLIRGLVIQHQYTSDPEFIASIMARWVEMVSPLLRPRVATNGLVNGTPAKARTRRQHK
jgi:AcrR family transcriptional regulator